MSTSLTTTLIASTTLYTFNCSYLTECSQCLSAQLGGSCVWCAKNSKCVFAKSSTSPVLDAECPNEIEFYRGSLADSHVDSMCTSLQWVYAAKKGTPTAPSPASIRRVEIAYSAETSLAQTTSGQYRLAIKNPHRNYQLNFKCVFSKRKSVSAEELYGQGSSSDVEWLPEDSVASQTPNMYPFDCKYAPYNDAKQLSPDIALQSVYLSVWWSSQPSGGYQSRSMEGWNQVKLKSAFSDPFQGIFIFQCLFLCLYLFKLN